MDKFANPLYPYPVWNPRHRIDTLIQLVHMKINITAQHWRVPIDGKKTLLWVVACEVWLVKASTISSKNDLTSNHPKTNYNPCKKNKMWIFIT